MTDTERIADFLSRNAKKRRGAEQWGEELGKKFLREFKRVTRNFYTQAAEQSALTYPEYVQKKHRVGWLKACSGYPFEGE